MKKSLRMVAAAMAVSTLALNLSNVAAQSWVQRSMNEVKASLMNHDGVYVIQWGDTLGTIAAATGYSVSQLSALNNIADADFILAGSVLYFDEANNTVTYVDRATSEVTEVALAEVALTETTVAEWIAPVTEVVSEVAEWVEPESTESPVSTEVVTEEATEEITEVVTEMPLAIEATVTQLETETVTEWVEPVIEEESQAPIVTEAIVEEVSETVTELVTEEVTEEITEAVVEAPLASTAGMTPLDAFHAITSAKGLSTTEIEQWHAIITRESNWNPTIANPYSGAYGLPQALPGNKMASHGADWETNPYTQLSWMYDYMIGRYGSIQGAFDHSSIKGWY